MATGGLKKNDLAGGTSGKERGKRERKANTNLQKRILLVLLEPVGTENLETASSLLLAETGVCALKELEDVVDVYFLNIDLVLVVKVLRLELDLGHVDRGI